MSGTFWNTCWHSETSPPDEMGDAICAGCGATVRTTLTRPGFMDFVDSVYRNGYGGQHSKRCVRLPEQEWICADNCRVS